MFCKIPNSINSWVIWISFNKFFINVDRVPWFTDNIYAITGTNTFKVTAKKLEWSNSGAAQVSYFNIMNIQELLEIEMFQNQLVDY